jgi:DNA-binding transcriptional regulator YdaS (Cro superfamily)
MKPETAIQWAGTQAELAKRLGISPSAVSQWVADGIVPEGRAYQIQVISAGAVRVDPHLYEKGAAA